ncbi:MAG: ABC transporter substrate-binding protein [Actinobacteria bacterium]|nr:ABC transporter substrate-binding protein [Actinomycetota bacterium]
MRWLPARTTTAAVAVVAVLLVAACGAEAERGHGAPDPAAWDTVTTNAEGQEVRWWMFGGDERINRYVDEEVIPRVEELGLSLERVPVDDTASAVQRVIAEQRAGATEGGSVDLIWINGENFAEGKEAGLWFEDWARELPNARFVNWDDDTINTDFGVPVDGQESPWSRAAFIYAYDQGRTAEPPRTFDELATYAEENPGRITYPAPPDFTGGAFVRHAVQSLGEDEAFALLERMAPHLWRQGETFPENEAELNQLFGNGEVDLAMSYDPNFVDTAVRQGTFPETARPFVFEGGTLQNVSYVTIPANAGNLAGALVVANLLLDAQLQAIKADPDGLGIPTVLDVSELRQEQQDLFTEAREDDPHQLADFGDRLEELPPERVTEIEERWQREILQR